MKNGYFNLLLCLIIFVMAGQSAFAQKYVTTKNAKKRALKAFNEGLQHARYQQYIEATYAFDKAIKKSPKFVDAYLNRADAYYAMTNFAKAEKDFEKVLEIAPDFNVRIYFVLGLTEYEQSKYEEAVTHIQYFLDSDYKGKRLLAKAKRTLENCKFAAEAVKNPVPFDPQNLGENINTPYPEYLPTITADGQTFIFTRRNGRQEDFYISKLENGKWSRAENLGAPINTPENEGAETISADGQTLVYTVCNRKRDFGSCDLYISEMENGDWSTPKNIGAPINSSAWESQPSLSADGKTLYYTSNRNGKDKNIYESNRLANGKWSAPKPISLNTGDNEEGPFIHPDGQTLYFTSNGYPGMGKADLFVSRLENDGTWGTPKNLGFPINTKAQEGALIVSLDGKTGYFASDKSDGYGMVDLYSFEMPQTLRPKVVTYAKIEVYDAATKEKLAANLDLVNLSTTQIHWSGVSKKDNEVLICLPTGTDYSLNANKTGYLFQSENFALKETASKDEPFVLKIYLQKIPPKPVNQPIASQEKPVSKPIVLKNVFFKTGSAELEGSSKVELNTLVKLLSDNESMNIQINGHTDDVGSDDKNLKLSENRAKSVVNFLIKQGIKASRLRSRGFGETQPISTNDSKEGKQLNRRTEFVVTQ